MRENQGIEKHIFKLLPPSNWHADSWHTVTLADYLANINAPISLNVSQFLNSNIKIFNDDTNKYDDGQTYFIVYGSKEEAEKHMKYFSDKFESYLKKFSKDGEYKLRYMLIR